jgi:hypothetical protein
MKRLRIPYFQRVKRYPFLVTSTVGVRNRGTVKLSYGKVESRYGFYRTQELI